MLIKGNHFPLYCLLCHNSELVGTTLGVFLGRAFGLFNV